MQAACDCLLSNTELQLPLISFFRAPSLCPVTTFTNIWSQCFALFLLWLTFNKWFYSMGNPTKDTALTNVLANSRECREYTTYRWINSNHLESKFSHLFVWYFHLKLVNVSLVYTRKVYFFLNIIHFKSKQKRKLHVHCESNNTKTLYFWS